MCVCVCVVEPKATGDTVYKTHRSVVSFMRAAGRMREVLAHSQVVEEMPLAYPRVIILSTNSLA